MGKMHLVRPPASGTSSMVRAVLALGIAWLYLRLATPPGIYTKLACTGRVSVAVNVDTIIIFWQLLLTEI